MDSVTGIAIGQDSPGFADQHCFLSASRGKYFDDQGHELPGPIEPVGDYRLHSLRTIDDEISDALGIPPAHEN